MFLFLRHKNGYPAEGNVQYLLQDGNTRWGHLVALKAPANCDYGISWEKIGTVDKFLKNKKENVFNPLNLKICDTPGWLDTRKEDYSTDGELTNRLPNKRKRNILPRKFKNIKRKNMGKNRNFKRNCQARM